jgi:hypothetical protein
MEWRFDAVPIAFRERVQAGSQGEAQRARNARRARKLAIQRLEIFEACIPVGESYRLHTSSIQHKFLTSSAPRWRAIDVAIECKRDFSFAKPPTWRVGVLAGMSSMGR